MRDNRTRENRRRQEERATAVEDRLLDLFQDASHEMIRGTTLLNSGAMIAMLGFTQALVKTTGWSCYKSYALDAMIVFMAGAIAGPFSFYLRSVWATSLLHGRRTLARFAIGAIFFCSGAAITGLIGGALIAGIGIYRSF